MLRQRREAQENGDYAAAFLLCAEGCRLLETLQNLSVTGELFASINRLYADTISRLEAALSSTCADFEASQYCKVDRTMSAADDENAHKIKLAGEVAMDIPQSLLCIQSQPEQSIEQLFSN